MKELTTYLLESLACGGVLYACYRLLLDRRVAFGWCRGWLLALPLLAAVIPLLRIPLYPGEVIYLTAAPAPQSGLPVPAEAMPATVVEAERITAGELLTWLYAAGAAAVLGAAAAQLWRIRQLGHGAAVTRTGRMTLVRTRQQCAAFSLFGRVYVWEQLPPRELEAVLLHEASHIRRRHSLERLAMELLKAALWWNPFVWLAARRLVEVEEYEADSDVLASGYAINSYIDILFMQLFGYSPEIANGLRSSLTKKRLKMMTSKTPSRHARLRLAATLPFIIGLLCAFAFTSRAAVILPAETAEPAATPATAPAATPAATAETPAVTTEMNLQQPAAAAPKAEPSEKSCRVHLMVALRDFTEDGKEFTMKRAASGVIVRVKDSTLGAVTDEKGVAELTVPQGCLLEVSNMGYETRLVEVPREERFSQSVMLDNSAGDTDNEARQPQQEGKPLVITFRDKDGVAGTPLYMVDGVETEIDVIPTNIGSVTFIYAEDAVKRYGEERGRFGALEITTRTLQEMAREKEEPPFIVAETMPLFEGGDLLKFRQWLQTQVHYPAKALEQHIEGRVVCSFVVEHDGSVSNIMTLQSPDWLLTNEVRRVLANSPRWTPGMQKGKTVRVKYVVPVDFRLPEKNEAATGAGTPAAAKTNGPATEEDAPVTQAETMPSFQGGDLTTFRQWLQTQVRYPAEALKEKTGGLTVCSFVVERDGSVSSIRALQSPDKLLSNEVERIIRASSSHWQPGRDKGKTVRVKLVLPVKFAIMGDKEHSHAKTPAPEGSVETLQIVGFPPEQ
ncbi:TonB family protein [uncultured Alistipes sp.]|uniref:TonB family protein n=1 Tax=uncultured Alistipes sp. TaxID=538949 RepID=UPI0025E80076|nr:TonB family protein [uncultured Alistipes sp.]